MSGYTKGPWTTQGWVPTWAYIPVDAMGGRVASCSKPRPDSDAYSEVVANARLIAAAPELLEALEALLSDMAVETLEDAARTDPNDTDGAKSTAAKFRKARAAIAKARGQ